jgi:dTDP-4-dehydrorhamnose reductase
MRDAAFITSQVVVIRRIEMGEQILANDPDQSEQVARAIEPTLTEEFPSPAMRPHFTALDCARFEQTFGLRLPDWSSTLKLAMTR